VEEFYRPNGQKETYRKSNTTHVKSAAAFDAERSSPHIMPPPFTIARLSADPSLYGRASANTGTGA
jgi:hypothetical protein